MAATLQCRGSCCAPIREGGESHMRRASLLRLLTRKSVVLYFACLLGFWNELIFPFIHCALWDTLTEENGVQAARILIVADPQLIGYRNEPSMIRLIGQADSDRYLSQGFFYALRHGRPDLIIFLGDLFDEGVEASEEEFALTKQRFDKIFTSYKSVQRVYVSGDNDIGGEGSAVSSSLKERFSKTFQSILSMRALGLRSVAVDEMNVFNGEWRNLTVASKEDSLSIMLSHAPVIRSFGAGARKAVERDSDLILSAHDHTAVYYERHRGKDTFDRTPIERDTVVEKCISKEQPVLELQTPTCSYRMGVPQMGYGLLTLTDVTLDQGTELQARYTVLWLPGRYPQLYSYAAVLLWLIILCAYRILYASLRAIVLRRSKQFKQNIV